MFPEVKLVSNETVGLNPCNVIYIVANGENACQVKTSDGNLIGVVDQSREALEKACVKFLSS